MSKNNFRFFVPLSEISKSKNEEGVEVMKMGGLASTKRRDTDNESLDPNGFDITYLNSRGVVNWNHSKDPSDVIGEPTKAEITKKGLYVESMLYADSDKAQKVYKLAETLRKSGGKRRLGYSIEGKATERDPLDETKVTKAMITNVALTISPKNPDSIVDIIKGNYNGWDDNEKPPIEPALDIEKALDGINKEYIVSMVRPDGMKVTVDGAYNVKISKSNDDSDEDDEDEEKAMTTDSGAAVIPEHVDGETKEMLNGGPQSKLKKAENDDTETEQYLTEEQVIQKILASDSVISFEKANKIFLTLKELTMSNTAGKTTTISDDLLEKSLAKLGFKKDSTIEKGKRGGEEEEDVDEKEEDEDEGGKEPAGKNKKSMKKSLTKSAVKKGYKKEDEDVDDEDSEEENRDDEKDEDERPSGSAKKKSIAKPHMEKSIKASRLVEVEDTNGEVLAKLDETMDMFKSLAIIAKGSYDLIKGQQDEIAEMREQLEALGEAAPAGRKSITKSAATPAARTFEKGMGADDTLEKSEDGTPIVDVDKGRNQVLTMLDHLAFNKGSYNDTFSKGMTLFESSGTMEPSIQKAIETEFKVKLVRRTK